MVELTVSPVDANGMPIQAPVVTLYILSSAQRECPMEPRIRRQGNFYSGAASWGAAMEAAHPGEYPGPYLVYGTVTADGFSTARFPQDTDYITWDGMATLNVRVTVNPKSASGPLPAAPSRDSVITVKAGFCNHSVDLPTYGGTIPWFDPYIDCLSAADRRAVYARKHALGYTHLVAGLGPQYGGYVVNSTYRDLREDIPTFASVVRSIIVEGQLIPIVSFTFGGQDDWHAWADNNGAKLRAAVDVFRTAGLIPYCLFAILWEVVDERGGGDWNAEQIDTMVLLWRDALGPEAHVAMELGQGYAHWGKGPGDLDGPVGLALDSFFYEAQQSVLGDAANAVKNEECTARLLGPASKNLDPKTQDPNHPAPWYMQFPSPRGPRTAVWFESCAYTYLHNSAPDSEILAINKWAGDRGWTDYGNGPV